MLGKLQNALKVRAAQQFKITHRVFSSDNQTENQNQDEQKNQTQKNQRKQNFNLKQKAQSIKIAPSDKENTKKNKPQQSQNEGQISLFQRKNDKFQKENQSSLLDLANEEDIEENDINTFDESEDFEEFDTFFNINLFNQWKSQQSQETIDTISKLDKYARSQELVNLIQQKLSNSQESKDYLSQKLKMTGSSYGKLINQGLTGDLEFHQNELIKNLADGEFNPNSFGEPKVLDSYTTPGGQKIFQQKFMPSNNIDVSQYQRDRRILSYEEYSEMVENDNQAQEWKEEFNRSEFLKVPILNQDLQQKLYAADEDIEHNKEQQSQFDEQEDLVDLYSQNLQSELDETGRRQAREQREMIRNKIGSVGPEKGFERDQVKLDLGRDIQYELMRKFSRGPVYDSYAAFRTMDNTTRLQVLDANNQIGRVEHLDEKLQMLNSESDEESLVDENYVDIIQDEHSAAIDFQEKIVKLRQDIAFNYFACKNLFAQVGNTREKFVIATETRLKEKFENQTTTHQQFDFLDKEDKIQKNLIKRENIKQIQQIQKEAAGHTFDPKIHDIKMYERELLIISKQAQYKENKIESLQKFDFVFDLINKNGIEMNNNIKSRLFEFAVLNQSKELANSMLKTLANSPISSCPIDPKYLQQYFDFSLKRDNFEGIAFLSNYCEKQKIKIGNWNLSNFRTAINHYLNVDFNISKVMVFTKFYQTFYNSRKESIMLGLHQETLEQEKNLNRAAKAIFDKHDNLVDMQSLFTYIVEFVDNKQLIDPLTKQDALWSLINFFTKDPQFYKVSQINGTNTIEIEQIAKYFGNQLDQPESLDRIFKIALRLDQIKQGSTFSDSMLRQLRSYLQKNDGQLPKSFSKKEVQKLYLTLRSNKKLSLSVGTSEILLFILKSANLNSEIIDYCTLKTTPKNSQVIQFYLAEALMQMDLNPNSTYEKVLKQAQVLPESGDLNSCQLTQGVKAVFLDQGASPAIKYFDQHYEHLKNEQHARDHLLVAMYDSVFKSSDEVSLEQFKKNYLSSSLVASRVARESYAVSQLEKVIKDKDYDQIQQIFNMYTLMQEEKQLILQMEQEKNDQLAQNLQNVRERRKLIEQDFTQVDVDHLLNIQQIMKNDKIEVINKQTATAIQHYIDMFKGMTLQDADDIRKRHEVVVSQASQVIEEEEDEDDEYYVEADDIENLEEQMIDSQDVDDYLLSDLARYTQNNLDEDIVIGQDEKLDLSDDEDDEEIDNKINHQVEIKRNNPNQIQMKGEIQIDDFSDDDEDEEKDVDEEKQQIQLSDDEKQEDELLALQIKTEEEASQTLATFQKLFSTQVQRIAEGNQGLIALPDEEVIQDFADQNMTEKYNKLRQEDLTQAGDMDLENERFEVDYYNKQRIDEPMDSDDENDILRDPELLVGSVYNESLIEMREELLEALTFRKKKVLPIALNIFNKVQEKQYKSKKIGDFDKFEKLEQVKSIDENLNKISYLLTNTSSPIISGLVETEKYNQSDIKYDFEEQYEQEQDMLKPLDIDQIKRDYQRLETLNQDINSLHKSLTLIEKNLESQTLKVQSGELDSDPTQFDSTFKAKHDKLIENLYQEFKKRPNNNLSKQDKIRFMKEALTLQLGPQYTGSIYPSFYAQDLIAFGLERRIPDAIRLGERILEEQGGTIPEGLAKNVRNFMLKSSNQKRYRQGIKTTGPLSNTKPYHSQDGFASPLICMDDPYWREFMAKNSRREDIWRTPSMYAWNHKEDGLIGEVLDVQRLRQKYDKYVNNKL